MECNNVLTLSSGRLQSLMFEHEDERGELKADDVLSYSTGKRLIIRPVTLPCS